MCLHWNRCCLRRATNIRARVLTLYSGNASPTPSNSSRRAAGLIVAARGLTCRIMTTRSFSVDKDGLTLGWLVRMSEPRATRKSAATITRENGFGRFGVKTGDWLIA
jgi:hypothetical protein